MKNPRKIKICQFFKSCHYVWHVQYLNLSNLLFNIEPYISAETCKIYYESQKINDNICS